jgi:hypothetical protein
MKKLFGKRKEKDPSPPQPATAQTLLLPQQYAFSFPL